jgi:hypothetical protein
VLYNINVALHNTASKGVHDDIVITRLVLPKTQPQSSACLLCSERSDEKNPDYRHSH